MKTLHTAPLKKALVLFSGGADSLACVAYYHSLGYTVDVLHVSYGHASARRERATSLRIANYLGLSLHFARITGLSVPRGFIPARNGLLAMVALSHLADSTGIVSLGIHAGTIYADCTPAFVRRIQEVYDLYTAGRVLLDTPFVSWNKIQVLEYLVQSGYPIELTYSCERGLKQPCGMCASCHDISVMYAK